LTQRFASLKLGRKCARHSATSHRNEITELPLSIVASVGGCGGRFNATSPRKHYCSTECEKQARYQTRLKRGDFKDGMASTRQRKRQAKDAETKQQEKMKKQQERRIAEEFYQKVMLGYFNEESPPNKYSAIFRLLGDGDEVKGHNKIVGWNEDRLKFEQIEVEDQKFFITCVREQSQKTSSCNYNNWSADWLVARSLFNTYRHSLTRCIR